MAPLPLDDTMNAAGEASMDSGSSDSSGDSGGGLSSIELNFLVVGVLFFATCVMGFIYFFLQHGGLDMCKRTVLGMQYGGPERVQGSGTSGAGQHGGGRGAGGAKPASRGIKMKPVKK